MSIPTPFNPLGTLGAEQLPPGFRRLEYVRFDKLQEIDTGVIWGPGATVSVDLLLCSTPGQGEAVPFAARDITQTNSNNCLVFDNNRVPGGLTISVFYKGVATAWEGETMYDRHSIVWEADGYVTLDGVRREVAAGSKPFYHANDVTTLKLGWISDAYGRKLDANVYAASASLNGELLHSWLPAADASGRACLYDTVTKTPYYSTTGIDFISPEP